jgi:hypothetical protein
MIYYCFVTEDKSKLVARDMLDMVYKPMESGKYISSPIGNILEIIVERVIGNEWQIVFQYKINN